MNLNDNVRDLVELFNSGKIKYQDIQDLFEVSRDLIKSRLAGIGLRFDNSEKKFVGDPTEENLNTPLLQLFEKQRNKQIPKVRTNKRTNVGSKELTNEPAKEQIKQAEKELAPTKELTNEPTKEQTKERTNVTTNVVRKRSSFDIDVELMKDLKIQAIIHNRNVYEIVETAIRQYLNELKK